MSSKYLEKDFYIGDYIIKGTIGEGTFGKVKSGIYLPKMEKVAIKILEKESIKEKDDYERVQRELEMIQKFNHPNVILVTEIFANIESYYIVMEYCEGGELFNYIVKKRRLSEEESSFFFYQLIQGLEYIHSLGIVHRDLKPENLLLTKDHTLKIIDFGLSNYFRNKLLSTPCGSPCYASPEMVSSKKYNGFKTDVWASGIILFAMLCGYLPFEDKNNDVLFEKILRCQIEFPRHLTDISKDIMKKILVIDPDKRITIPEIKRHPFYLQGRNFFRNEFMPLPQEFTLAREDLIMYDANKTEGNEKKQTIVNMLNISDGKEKNNTDDRKASKEKEKEKVKEKEKEKGKKNNPNREKEKPKFNHTISNNKNELKIGSIHSLKNIFSEEIKKYVDYYSKPHEKISRPKTKSKNRNNRGITSQFINSMRFPFKKAKTNTSNLKPTSKITSKTLKKNIEVKKDTKQDTITIKNTVINLNMIDPIYYIGKILDSKKAKTKRMSSIVKYQTHKNKSFRKKPQIKVFDFFNTGNSFATTPFNETILNTQENINNRDERKNYRNFIITLETPILKGKQKRELTLSSKVRMHSKIKSMKSNDGWAKPMIDFAKLERKNEHKNNITTLNNSCDNKGNFQFKLKHSIENSLIRGRNIHNTKNVISRTREKYHAIFLKELLSKINKK